MSEDVRKQMEQLAQDIEDKKLEIKKLRLDLQSLDTKFERLATRNPEIAKDLGWEPEPPPSADTNGQEKRGPGRPPKAEKPAAAPAKS